MGNQYFQKIYRDEIFGHNLSTRKIIALMLLENTGKGKLEGSKETITMANRKVPLLSYETPVVAAILLRVTKHFPVFASVYAPLL